MKIITFVVLFGTGVAWALDPNQDLRIKETGQLFTVVLTPRAHQTEVFVSGNKVTNFQIQDMQIEGSYLTNFSKKNI